MGEDAVAIFLGAGLVTRSRDSQFAFRQDSDFLYLTGFDHPGAVAVLSTTGGPTYTLYVEPRDREMETWNGYRPGVEGARRDYEADEAHPNDAFRGHIPELVRKARRIYHVLGRDAGVDAKLFETLESLRLRSRQGIDPADAIVDPRTLVHEMRLFKEPQELDTLRRAAAISAEAHDAAARLACRAPSSTSWRPRCCTPSAGAGRPGPPTRRSWAAAATPPCCTTCGTTRSWPRESWC
jgi:Xaa-Pro aminopeptidase